MSATRSGTQEAGGDSELGRAQKAGKRLGEGAATLVMLHGRGATAESILDLFGELDGEDCSAIAPQAEGFTWYPQSFLAPLAANQPFLDRALARLGVVISELKAQGVAGEKIVLIGFSQGACLALEFAARHAQRFGALIGLTGGLIGPAGTPRAYAGALDGTPIFLGSGDPDAHVPFARVEETAEVMRRMGATVDLRRYPGLPHTVNEDELEACRLLVRQAASQ